MEMPAAFLKQVEKFSANDWATLLAALKNDDKVTAAKMLGITPEQADAAFKQIKERAQEVFKAHPKL
jgi:hypothetical protein